MLPNPARYSDQPSSAGTAGYGQLETLVHRSCSIAILVLLSCLGCGGHQTIDPAALQDAQQAYDEAITAEQNSEYERASELLAVALQPGSGLPPDVYSDAVILRAIVRARQGELDLAMEDVELASQGASDLARVAAVRSYVLDKQGQSSESKAAWNAARKLDRRVKRVRDK